MLRSLRVSLPVELQQARDAAVREVSRIPRLLRRRLTRLAVELIWLADCGSVKLGWLAAWREW